MNTIKQRCKGDNVRQRSLNILKFFKNNSSKNVIKKNFDIDFHHNPTKVYVKEGINAKRDSFTTFRGQYCELMGG